MQLVRQLHGGNRVSHMFRTLLAHLEMGPTLPDLLRRALVVQGWALVLSSDSTLVRSSCLLPPVLGLRRGVGWSGRGSTVAVPPAAGADWGLDLSATASKLDPPESGLSGPASESVSIKLRSVSDSVSELEDVLCRSLLRPGLGF